ncbi:hypothetical protein [Novosphingobium sp. KA1]|uniref:hypothetical protein n=1 Tax=Novosphingobium sp. (strain KA1) TaxID=164608 RepID=UPI001A8C7B6E|nr:hypothetical protein [Novosphingobium sp. KA1]QSR16052.1 hypothetical protein CA833_02375 [Novosphingobium sp. KA1]
MTKKAQILDKRARQRASVGFSPVPNVRVAQALQIAYLEQIKLGLTPTQAMEEAERAVARQLPPVPFGRRSYRLPKPSRSDDPAYRKPIRVKRHLSCSAA